METVGTDVEPIAGDERGAETTLSRVRRGAFALVVLATLALAGVMMRAELLLALTGWTANLGTHQIHDLTIFSMLWIALLAPMALLLYRPLRRVNVALAPVVFLVPLAAFAVWADSPIAMLPLLFGGLSTLALLLHPAGRDLLRFDRVGRIDRPLAAVLVVGAVPLLAYAGGQVIAQVSVADEHALLVHYASMGTAAVYVVVMGALAVFRERDWRFAAWSAGLVAAVLGAASIGFPVASGVGTVGGALLIGFAVALVAGVEYTRRSTGRTDPDPVAA